MMKDHPSASGPVDVKDLENQYQVEIDLDRIFPKAHLQSREIEQRVRVRYHQGKLTLLVVKEKSLYLAT